MINHKSSFKTGWEDGIVDGKSIVASVRSGLLGSDAIAGKGVGFRERVEDVLREYLLDDVLDNNEKRRLQQEFGWADQELVSVISFLSDQIDILDSALLDLGRGFGRITKVVENYQNDLAMAAPTAWEAYPELFDFKTKRLDALTKNMMSRTKVLDYGEKMITILDQLRGRLIGTHQYVRGNALTFKASYMKGAEDADLMVKIAYANKAVEAKGFDMSNRIESLMRTFLDDNIFSEEELEKMAEEFGWANEELSSAANVTSGYTQVIGKAIEDFSRAYGRLLYMLYNFEGAISSIAPTASSAYPQLFASTLNKMRKLTDAIVSTEDVKDYATELQNVFDELTDHIDETHRGLLQSLVGTMEQHGYALTREEEAYLQDTLAG